jgi:hypothetical protein
MQSSTQRVVHGKDEIMVTFSPVLDHCNVHRSTAGDHWCFPDAFITHCDVPLLGDLHMQTQTQQANKQINQPRRSQALKQGGGMNSIGPSLRLVSLLVFSFPLSLGVCQKSLFLSALARDRCPSSLAHSRERNHITRKEETEGR